MKNIHLIEKEPLFTAQTDDVVNALAFVIKGSTAEFKFNYLLLDHVKIKAYKNKVGFSCTDGTTYVNKVIDATVHTENILVTKASLLNNYIRSLKGSDIKFTVAKKPSLKGTRPVLIVNKGSGNSLFPLETAKGFPIPKFNKKDNYIKVSAPKILRDLRKISIAFSKKEIDTKVANYLLLEIHDNCELSLVATDLRKLIKTKDNINSSEKNDYLVPLRTVNVLIKMLSKCKEGEELSINKSFNKQLLFYYNGCTVIANTYTKKSFIDYRKIINPLQNNDLPKAIFNRRDLLEVINRLSTSSTNLFFTPITINIDKNKAFMTTSKRSIVYSEEFIDVNWNGQDKSTIILKGIDINKILNQIESDKVVLRYDKTSLMLEICSLEDDLNYNYYIKSLNSGE